MKNAMLGWSLVLIFSFTAIEASAQDDKPCLDFAYPKGQGAGSEAKFDRANDKLNVHGASFSCETAIAASKARDALESFRFGVLYHDKEHIDSVLQYPLTVRVRKTREGRETPEVVIVHNFQEWSSLQNSEMSKIQIAVIACAWLGGVTVTAPHSPGFNIGNGMVWFQRNPGSSKVWVTSVNLFPITAEMLTESCSP